MRRRRRLEHPRELAWSAGGRLCCGRRRRRSGCCGRRRDRAHLKGARELARRRGDRCGGGGRGYRLRPRQGRRLKSACEFARRRGNGHRGNAASGGGNNAIQPCFERIEALRQQGDNIRSAFVVADVDDGAAILRGHLARPLDQPLRFGRLPGCEQVHLNHSASGNLPAAEDPDPVPAEDLKQLIFLVKVHDTLTFCPAPSGPRNATAPLISYGRVYSCAKRLRRLCVDAGLEVGA